MAGVTWSGTSFDYQVLKLNASGTTIWERPWNDKYNFDDRVSNFALDVDGQVVLTGQSMKPDNSWGYATVRLVEADLVVPADSDSISTSLRFLANRDQLLGTDGDAVERVRFYAQNCYPNVYLMDDTLSYVFAHIDDDTTTADTMHRIDMSFNAASAATKLIPMDKEAYFNNYYLGHIPEGRPFVSLYKRLAMKDVWPGIDVAYSSNQRGLKYYLVVHPGGEPSAISLHYGGQDAISVDGNGALVLESSVGTLVQPQALAYEMDASGELTLLAWQPDYDLSGDDVAFDGLGSWDTGGDLVIEVNWGYVGRIAGGGDNLNWSTYYGGAANDKGLGLAVDGDHNIYNCGYTESLLFPTGSNPAPDLYNSARDAYVGKFSPSRVLEWTTFFGGSQNESANAMFSFRNDEGIACTGYTTSSDFPALPNSSVYSQTLYGGGGSDAYLVQLRADGTRNSISYFGGSGSEFGRAIAQNNAGVYIAGRTTTVQVQQTCGVPQTGKFPVCNSTLGYFQPTIRGTADGFIAQFIPDGGLGWSTYFGGDGTSLLDDDDIWDIEVDPMTNELYIVGSTSESTVASNTTAPCSANGNGDFPACNPGAPAYFQTVKSNSPRVGFIARFDYPSNALRWSTYFGGEGADDHAVTGLAFAPSGDLYVVGEALIGNVTSTCSPPTSGVFPLCDDIGGSFQQSSIHPGTFGDSFIARFNANRKLVWSTPFGTDFRDHFYLSNEYGREVDVAVDGNGNAYMLGSIGIPPNTSSSNYLATQYSGWYLQSDIANVSENEYTGDAYLVGFETSNNIFWSTIFGGNSGNLLPQGLQFTVGSENGSDIIADGTSSILITGGTGSPATRAACPNLGAWCQGSLVDGFTIDSYVSEFAISTFVVARENENIDEKNLSVFPNPTIDVLNIRTPQDGGGKINMALYDGLGNFLFSKVCYVDALGQTEIDMRRLPSGLYFLSVSHRNGISTQRIIKL